MGRSTVAVGRHEEHPGRVVIQILRGKMVFGTAVTPAGAREVACWLIEAAKEADGETLKSRSQTEKRSARKRKAVANG